MLKTAVKIHII